LKLGMAVPDHTSEADAHNSRSSPLLFGHDKESCHSGILAPVGRPPNVHNLT
jgi:hypothetical protein